MHARTIERAVRYILAGNALHAKRVTSLSQAVVGAVFAMRAGVASIGRALANARGLTPKHAIKQFDRFLSNDGIDLDLIWIAYLGFVLGGRTKVVVSLDWTDYADGTQHRIALNLVTKHGRATPLIWKTVTSDELTHRRNEHEDELLRKFRWLMPYGNEQVVVLADRGFGDVALYELLHEELGFDFVIRFRGCILVESMSGDCRPGIDWVPGNGHALRLPHARLTNKRFEVEAVVAVKQAGMKDAWFLATSLSFPAKDIVKLYGRRFTIEENFRDEKDWRFGLGSRYVAIQRTDRRDRFCLVLALATVLLTLLGEAGERLGLDRGLRANTVKRRTHSLFRQGREYVQGTLGKVKDAAHRLAKVFHQLLTTQLFSTASAGVI